MRASKKRGVVPSALFRTAFWFCACNLLVAALSAQCTGTVTSVPPGTYTSGDHSQVDPNALSATNFAVSGGASATFSAGNCIELMQGFHANAIGATVPTTFHAWVDIAPTALSFSPNSPPQNPPLSQSFTWTVSSPAGRSNLSHVFALFNTTSATTANACYIHFDASSGLVYLADDTSTTWLGGFTPSGSGSAGNHQCTISGTNSSLNPTGAGTQLSLTLTVTFQPSFSGTQNEYLYALDSTGVTTGWQPMGTWTVPAPPAPDFTLTTTQNTQSVSAGVVATVTYTLTVTPLNGFSNNELTFSMASYMYGCYNTTINPGAINTALSPPPWTTTVTMYCYETTPTSLAAIVLASGGGKSHEIYLFLTVGPAQQYTLVTASNAPASGTVSPACPGPTGCVYASNSQITVTAIPATGYQFSGWNGVDSSSGTTGYVTMNANRLVGANFAPVSTNYTLTTNVSPSGGGTVSPSCPGGCSYASGSQVTITATPASGYQFSGWTGVDSSSGTTGYVTTNGNRSVTANFTQIGTGPSISAFSPASSGPVNSSLTIEGANFGTSQGTVTFTQGSTQVNASITSWSNTRIAVTVPTGMLVGSAGVTVTANGATSNSMTFTVTTTSTYTVSGQTTFSGCPLPGVTMSLTGVPSTITDATGSYSFTVPGGSNYQLSAQKTGYGFPPPVSFSPLSQNQSVNFAATTGPVSREYIRLGGRVIAIANCGAQ